MADLSTYTPIYVRTTGSDITGNGSLNNPYFTAQKAFEFAYTNSGGGYGGYGGYGGGGSSATKYVLDFGIGNFGGVDLSKVIVLQTTNFGHVNLIEIISSNSLRLSYNYNLAYDPGVRYFYSKTSNKITLHTITSGYTNVIDGTTDNDQTIIVFDPPLPSGAVVTDDNPLVILNSVNFFYINQTLSINNWPSNIAVRGINPSQSLLGGITANGSPPYSDPVTFIGTDATPGKNVHILSNNTANIGNITSNGGIVDGGGWTGASGGNITLIDCCGNNITSSASAVTDLPRHGGNINLIGCFLNNISSNGSKTSIYGASFGIEYTTGGNGGNITLLRTKANNISSISGGANSGGGYNGVPGTITLTRSEAYNISSNCGGPVTYAGNGGTIHMYSSKANNIEARGGYGDGGTTLQDGSGGSVVLVESRVNDINVGGSYGLEDFNFSSGSRGYNGTITISNYSILPNNIKGNLNITNLFKGSCPNSMASS